MTYVLGAKKNPLNETVLLSTHNIGFGLEIRKIFFVTSIVPRSRFLVDTSVPLPEFQRDICKFWGTHQFHLILTCKIENSFPEISVHFYLHFELDVDSFGSRRGADYSEVVSTLP